MMKKYVESLSDCKDILTNLYIESVDVSNTHFQYNIFLSCILDRALSVNRGYLSLTESNNYFCAVAMLRMQIENCTRLYGMTLVDDTCKYISSWMSGEKVCKFQDVATHKSLSDSYVASILDKQYKNIAAMYKEACSFVHFSERQLYDTAKVKPGTRTVNLKVSEEDALKDEEKHNIDKCMLNVNNILIDIVKNISKEYVQPNTDK
jgi:hypothetical protein